MSHLNITTDYINQYRNPKELVMGLDWLGLLRRRDGYMLVNLISALQFVSTIDASCLSINPIDYQM